MRNMRTKKAIVSIVLAIMFLTIACLGTAARNNQDNDYRNIHSITFVHYAKSSDTTNRPPFDDTEDDFKVLGLKLISALSYELNPSGSDLDESEVISVLQMSLATWDSETSFDLFDDTITITTGSSAIGDDKSTISWSNLGSSGIIAQNSLRYNKATGEIIESDVTFNSYYSWSTTGESTAMDLQNIATHEFGHNGLADLRSYKDFALTMYGRSGPGEIIKRTLGTGDILGIQAVYGSS